MAEVNDLRGKISGLTVYHTDAYEIAVANGFEGSIEDWLESLHGNDALHSVQTKVVDGVLVMVQKES